MCYLSCEVLGSIPVHNIEYFSCSFYFAPAGSTSLQVYQSTDSTDHCQLYRSSTGSIGLQTLQTLQMTTRSTGSTTNPWVCWCSNSEGMSAIPILLHSIYKFFLSRLMMAKNSKQPKLGPIQLPPAQTPWPWLFNKTYVTFPCTFSLVSNESFEAGETYAMN